MPEGIELHDPDDLTSGFRARRDDIEKHRLIDRLMAETEDVQTSTPAAPVSPEPEPAARGPLTQVIGGVRDAAQETIEAVADLSRFMEEQFPLGSVQIDEEGNVTLVEGFQETIPQLPEVPPPTTTAGSITRTVAQFLTGFIPAAKLFKLGKAAGLGDRAIRSMGAGASTDAVVFDPEDPRLADLLLEHDILAGPITEYLAGSPDDTRLEGRLKNALEGAGLGLLGEGLFLAVKGIRAARRALQKPEGAPQADAQAEADAVAQALTKQVEVDVVPLGDPSKPLFPITPQVREAADRFLGIGPKEEPGPPRFTGDQEIDEFASELADAALKIDMEDFVQSADFPLALTALRRTNLGVEGALRRITDFADDMNPPFKALKRAAENERLFVEGLITEDEFVSRMSGTLAAPITIKRITPVSTNEAVLLKDRVLSIAEAGVGRDVDEELSEIIRQAGTETGPLPAKVGNLNLARIGGPEDVREAIATTARAFEGKLAHATQGFDQTTMLANEIGKDPDKVRALLESTGAFRAEEITALRFLLHTSAGELQRMGQQVMSIGASEVDMFAFRRQMAFHAALLGQVSRGAREAGRALGAFNIVAQGAQEQTRTIRELLATQGGPELTREMAQMAANLMTPSQLNAFAKGAAKATTKDMLMEAWINGLLSSPATHAVNVLSNAMVAFWQVPERLLASQIRAFTGGGGVAQGETAALAYGMLQGLKDGFRLAGRSLIKGEPSDLMGKIENLDRRAIRGQSFGLEEGSLWGRGLDLLGEVVRVPGRLLTTEDEFFKAVGYRMELRARSYRQAVVDEGLGGQEAARRIEELTRNPPEDLRLAAIDAARVQTFTAPLGRTGARGQAFVASHRALRLIMPFIRTPVNIMKFVGVRSPLAPFAKSFQADVAAGGARRDLALARMALGSMVMMIGTELSANGLITGAGPVDRSLRSTLRRTGWQPHSIKIGDTYYAYNRLDPIGMFLGIAADITEVLGQVDEADANALASSAVVAISQNLISKTYLQGISELIQIFDEGIPELGAARGERYINRLVASFVPFTSLVAGIEREVDPTMRVARTIIDSIRARVPGFSEDLPPVRNLWGEPILLEGGLGPDIISPIYQSAEKGAPIDHEMARLGIGRKMPARRIANVELTEAEYDRFVVLAGHAAENPLTGKGLKESLNDLIKDPFYAAATDGPEGMKAVMIHEQIDVFRELARQQMQAEFSDLAARIKLKRGERIQQLLGPSAPLVQ